MANCIVCNKEIEVVKTIKAISNTNAKWYDIVYCKCGLGKTMVDGDYTTELMQANADMYDSVEERIKIYYGKLSNHYQLRINELLGFIEKYSSGKRLLELGANIGFTSNLARQRGFDVEVCELNDHVRSFAEQVYHLRSNK